MRTLKAVEDVIVWYVSTQIMHWENDVIGQLGWGQWRWWEWQWVRADPRISFEEQLGDQGSVEGQTYVSNNVCMYVMTVHLELGEDFMKGKETQVY